MKDYLQQLQSIATQAIPESPTASVGLDEVIATQDMAKVTGITDLAITMYPEDKASRFDFWKSQIKTSSLAPAAKDAYWKQYETMHPEGKVGATRDFLSVTKRELDVVSGLAGKEFFLRERLSDTPAWARKELDPVLGELSATVANSNFAKSQQVYMKDLEERVGRFSAKAQLDPDIPIDTHTNDIARLEQLNLMTLGVVVGGRVGVYNEVGKFYPAFGLKDRTEIFKKDPAGSPELSEQALIRDLSPNIIRKAVAGNLAVSRNKIQADERASATLSSKYLEEGAFNMDKWDTAFAMLPEVPIHDKVLQGLKGEITSGRLRSDKDLVRGIYQAMVRYGNLFTKET